MMQTDLFLPIAPQVTGHRIGHANAYIRVTDEETGNGIVLYLPSATTAAELVAQIANAVAAAYPELDLAEIGRDL